MAKSLRSKWRRKMRAIKRASMEDKILNRMKKMLADHEQAEKENAREEESKTKTNVGSVSGVTEPASQIETETAVDEGAMDVDLNTSEKQEGSTGKKKGPNLRKMRNADNRYPAWMSTKKIKRHNRMLKKKEKRLSKVSKKGRQWKIAMSS